MQADKRLQTYLALCEKAVAPWAWLHHPWHQELHSPSLESFQASTACLKSFFDSQILTRSLWNLCFVFWEFFEALGAGLADVFRIIVQLHNPSGPEPPGANWWQSPAGFSGSKIHGSFNYSKVIEGTTFQVTKQQCLTVGGIFFLWNAVLFLCQMVLPSLFLITESWTLSFSCSGFWSNFGMVHQRSKVSPWSDISYFTVSDSTQFNWNDF